MRDARPEIPKEESYSYYGDDARKMEIGVFGDHGAFIRVLSKDVARDGVRTYGRFVYTTKNKALKSAIQKQKHIWMADEG